MDEVRDWKGTFTHTDGRVIELGTFFGTEKDAEKWAAEERMKHFFNRADKREIWYGRTEVTAFEEEAELVDPFEDDDDLVEEDTRRDPPVEGGRPMWPLNLMAAIVGIIIAALLLAMSGS